MKQIKNLVGLIVLIGIGYQYFVSGPGPSVSVGQDQDVYYRGSVTEEQARAAGAVLKEKGLMAENRPATVQLVGEADKVRVRFVIKDGAHDDPTVKELFADMGFAVSQEVFAGKSVEVDLCDDKLETRKSFPAKELGILQFGKNQILYADGVAKSEAEATLELLKEIEYMSDSTGNAVRLSKQGEALVVQFALGAGAWDREDLFEAWQEIVNAISERVVASGPVKLKLCDSDLHEHREFVSAK